VPKAAAAVRKRVTAQQALCWEQPDGGERFVHQPVLPRARATARLAA